MDFDASLTQTIEDSFTQYAGAVIQSRALVDVRDCVKPSARQIYWCLYTDKFTSDKPFKKTLKAVGSSMRVYIHGDASCEGIIMRSGQPFSLRYPLVEVEGSYGNQTETGNWAASRYTSSRLSPLANYLIDETDKYTIDEWADNYDDTEQYPRVLSSLGFYNIVNGSFGIAVGLASSIPQFNLKEVNDAMIALLKDPDIDEDKIICLPDFATGGTIINKDEVVESLKKGTGKAAIIQAKIDYDEKDNCLVVSELPYGVYTNTICTELEKLAEKNDNFPIVRINDLTGEQVCIKLYLNKVSKPQDIIEYLYQNTSLQSSYSINLTMLQEGRFPQVYRWKDALIEHLRHESNVYTKMYQHLIAIYTDKLYTFAALIKAVQRIDEVVSIIKKASSTKEANKALQERLQIEEKYAKAILDMRLARLTKLELESLIDERDKIFAEKQHIANILSDKDLFIAEMVKRFQEVSKKFGDNRRTQVIQKEIVAPQKTKKEKVAEPVVVCYTENGYIKSVPAAKYRKVDGNLGCIETTTDGYIQIYNTTKVYRLKVSSIKQCLASEKGTALGIILGTGLTHIRMIAANGEDKDVIAVSKSGRIKKFNTSLFNGTTQNIRGQEYFPKNETMFIESSQDKYVTFVTNNNKTLSCDTSVLKCGGKASTGRVGIKLDDEDVVIKAIFRDVKPSVVSTFGTKGKKNIIDNKIKINI